MEGTADILGEILRTILNYKIWMTAFETLLPSAGVAFVTWSVVELFMNKEVKIPMPKYVTSKEGGLALWIVFIQIILPFIILIFAFNTHTGLSGIFWPIIILQLIGLYLTFQLSRLINSDIQNTYNQLFRILGEDLAERISAIGATIIAFSASVILKIGHYALIGNYFIVSVFFNISTTVFLVSIMNASASAGMANLIGGAIGNIVHAKLSAKRRAELEAKYIRENKLKAKRMKNATRN